jgi:hypothetical protein
MSGLRPWAPVLCGALLLLGACRHYPYGYPPGPPPPPPPPMPLPERHNPPPVVGQETSPAPAERAVR